MQDTICAFALDHLCKLLKIDSPTGFTGAAADFVIKKLSDMGFSPIKTNKGGVLCCLGGMDENNGLILSAHIDTLGGMVTQIKGNGHLKIRNIGGLEPNNIETESVRVYTRDDRFYEGTLQLCNPSVHVNTNYTQTSRTFDTLEIVLDEDVKTAEDVKALGIEVGCFACVDPRTKITENGYIKSRFLDNKLSSAILLAFAKSVKEENLTLPRKTYLHFTVYEEIGHGAAGTCPDGVTEIFGVDMGCVGDGLECTEKQVSICAADSSGPYNYDGVCALVRLAKENNIDHAVDIYPHYGSDCSAAIRTFDLKHILIGPGVFASHGYERSHIDGMKNTYDLMRAYTLL
ncbi:MAG: M42 family metallopeptidase [Clostridia bacterium]|nr:M42 family metallopeptidase [Clostridia bacterium]